jgi:GNAT superfamily N-acetyltransferase
MRDLYRQENACQIIHDSAIRRAMADPYLVLLDGTVAGYGAVWNQYDPGTVMEYYTLPRWREHALPMFGAFLSESKATRMEAQTNIPLMLLMLYDCAKNIRAKNYLFYDARTTHLPCPGGQFRQARPGDAELDPEKDWVIEEDGAIVAHGGFLCHYNPPYGDVYMGVDEPARRRGFGSYIVQELKRICYEAGRRPAARCNADNVASRRTLQKAGMLPCGRLLVGKLALKDPS